LLKIPGELILTTLFIQSRPRFSPTQVLVGLVIPCNIIDMLICVHVGEAKVCSKRIEEVFELPHAARRAGWVMNLQNQNVLETGSISLYLRVQL
jgi:hypothetical protein